MSKIKSFVTWRHRRGFDKLSTIYSLLFQKIFKAQICKVQKITAPMHAATLETDCKGTIKKVPTQVTHVFFDVF